VDGKNASCRANYVGWAVGGAADGYGMILRTDDSGLTWSRQGGVGEIPDIDLGGVSAVDKKHAWVVGGQVILHTSDGGLTWEEQELPAEMPPDFELFAVKALNKHTVFVVGDPGILLGTTDGVTWTILPASPDLPLVNYQDVDAVDKKHVWAVGVVHSDTNDRSGLAVAFYDGKRWEPQVITHTSGADPCNAFIGVSVLNPRTVWAVGGGDCPPYKTVDGGATWQPVGQPLDAFDTNRVVAVTHDRVWVAHDAGVSRTTDGGMTWETSDTGCIGIYCHAISAAGTKCAWVANYQPPGYLYRWVDGDHWESQPVPSQKAILRISFVGARR